MKLKTALELPKNKLIELLKTVADNSGGAFYIPKTNNCKNQGCLVCHIDTVWDDTRNGKSAKVYHDEKEGVYWSPDGLGADDRAGLWACAELKRKTGCAVLILDGEERGGWGARDAVKYFFEELIVHKYFLEIDRRGRGEFVCYAGEPHKFRKFIKSFGFSEHVGSFSDISILCSSLLIPGANLSAGYYFEHTHSEYLIEKDLEYTVRQVEKMLKAEIPDTWGDWQKHRRKSMSYTYHKLMGEEEI